jgi:hypothetical protein
MAAGRLLACDTQVGAVLQRLLRYSRHLSVTPNLPHSVPLVKFDTEGTAGRVSGMAAPLRFVGEISPTTKVIVCIHYAGPHLNVYFHTVLSMTVICLVAIIPLLPGAVVASSAVQTCPGCGSPSTTR